MHHLKIINDPIYGFLKVRSPQLLSVIDHPWFQRLRRIKQMGLAHLVYPGAVHTRFHHSLGALHLMQLALQNLEQKGSIVPAEFQSGAAMAILLHDIGHGPFSHALEHSLVQDVNHEYLSSIIIRRMNDYFDGMLEETISIFNQQSDFPYLHQLVSSQLDMDRMDYLNRDSFYTGVSEGVIGWDRILQMINIREQELVVEEKGIHSVEKFVVARKIMYWQVYLHKTVLAAELVIINILKRAKELSMNGTVLFATPALQFFLQEQIKRNDFSSSPKVVDQFCALDDDDIMASVKVWSNHTDFILSTLCKMVLNRRLYKVTYYNQPPLNESETIRQYIQNKYKLNEHELQYFVLEGKATNNMYDEHEGQIKIYFKNGSIQLLSDIEHSLINSNRSNPVTKYYLAHLR